jgi:hypothetical protein
MPPLEWILSPHESLYAEDGMEMTIPARYIPKTEWESRLPTGYIPLPEWKSSLPGG